MSSETNGARDPNGVPARKNRTHDLEIVSTGYGYPSDIVDNDEFFARAKFQLDVDRAALAAETKMKFRRWCGPGETTWTMVRDAVRRAFANAPGIEKEIDVVLVASHSTIPIIHPADLENPGMSDLCLMILENMGRNDAFAMDLKGVYCSGFSRALETADGLLENPNYRAALLVCAEQGSRLSTAASNRSAFVYVGADGAGCAIVKKREPRTGGRVGVIDYVNYVEADKRVWTGIGNDGVSVVVRGSKASEAMLSIMVRAGKMLLQRNGLTPKDVTWMVPIQTYLPVVEEVSRQLEWPRDRVLWNGGEGGYTLSASIPATLAENIEKGVIKKGDLVMTLAVGTGISAGAALFYV